MSRIHWTIDGLTSGADYANSDLFDNIEDVSDETDALVADFH
jgi:hypothetical protein